MFTTFKISKNFAFCSKNALKLFSNNFQRYLWYFSFVFLLAYALLYQFQLTFSHDKSQSKKYIYIYIYSLEFHFIHNEYLISWVRIGEILGGPHAFTLFIRFYGISDDFFYLNSIFNCRSSAKLYHVCNLTQKYYF